ncbi:hypothetical protein F9B74_09720 [Pelistega sp. NLN82]|uniref:Uncharacterized protein n=1 Tax=Pelistega ratti TaxID=2652177 RepID=A0A6L9Y845_9BURK|nr:hypothetical protein [Pelistega ratti]NEN76581.1 hypothetical protein [Pelistega ratti]
MRELRIDEYQLVVGGLIPLSAGGGGPTGGGGGGIGISAGIGAFTGAGSYMGGSGKKDPIELSTAMLSGALGGAIAGISQSFGTVGAGAVGGFVGGYADSILKGMFQNNDTSNKPEHGAGDGCDYC